MALRRRQSNRYLEAERTEREALSSLSRRALEGVREGDTTTMRLLANMLVKGVLKP